MPGRILYLNGLTSSGKSTAAKCLAKLCRTPLFRSSNDIFHDMIASKFYAGHFWREIARTIGAQYAAVRGMAEVGFDVIVDGMGLDLTEYKSLFGLCHLDLVEKTFSGLDVTFVRFDCPAEELRRRNLLRGDRGEFQSEEQARLNDLPGRGCPPDPRLCRIPRRRGRVCPRGGRVPRVDSRRIPRRSRGRPPRLPEERGMPEIRPGQTRARLGRCRAAFPGCRR
jgi:adenylylsulfate kinase/chloramphenicol 3-O phosphotransferase